MNRKLHRAVRLWLARERADDPGAEAALAQVFARWPAPPLPPGLASAVLRATGLGVAAVGRLPAWVLRWAFGAGVVAAALAAAQLAGLAAQLDRAGLADLLARALVLAGEAAVAAQAVGGALIDAGQVFAASFRSPAVLVFCLAATFVALGAFWRLQALLGVDRSGYHA